MEIISLTGTLSCLYGSNLRISVSRENGSVMGGQVGDNLEILQTAEIVIGQCEDYVFKREYDARTGGKELNVKLK